MGGSAEATPDWVRQQLPIPYQRALSPSNNQQPMAAQYSSASAVHDRGGAVQMASVLYKPKHSSWTSLDLATKLGQWSVCSYNLPFKLKHLWIYHCWVKVV